MRAPKWGGAGETKLLQVAKRMKVDPDALLQANPQIADPNNLKGHAGDLQTDRPSGTRRRGLWAGWGDRGPAIQSGAPGVWRHPCRGGNEGASVHSPGAAKGHC